MSIRCIDKFRHPIGDGTTKRPGRHHVFLCMFACYVEWHMRERLRPLLFDDAPHVAFLELVVEEDVLAARREHTDYREFSIVA